MVDPAVVEEAQADQVAGAVQKVVYILEVLGISVSLAL